MVIKTQISLSKGGITIIFQHESVKLCLGLKMYRKIRYFVKDKLAWDVHSSAGRRINRQYKPLKVML